VGIDEIKADRDERIGKLRKEIEEFTSKYDELDKTHV